MPSTYLIRRGLAAMIGITLCAGPPPATAQAPSPNATYDDGLWQVPVRGGEPELTHGVDGPIVSDPDEVQGHHRGDHKSVVCATARENRYRALYAYPREFDDAGSEQRADFTRRAPQLRQVLMDASAIIDANARSFDVSAKLPVLCAGETVAVTQAPLPTSNADMDLETVLHDLRKLGFAKPNERYVVFIDGCFHIPQWGDGCADGGLGTIRRDDRATARNLNNGGPRYALEFGPIGKDPGGSPSTNPRYWYGLLHEIGHTMGAVQASAPHAHSTSRGHCDQGRDFMCTDQPEVALGEVPATPCLPRRYFDCYNDDYFHPNPPAGSYLAERWNLGSPNNHWLRFAAYVPAMR